MDAVHPARRGTVVAAAVVLVTLVTLALGASADAAKRPVEGPRGPGFYAPPDVYPKGHGKLIWQRQAGRLSPIAGAGSSKLVLYSSTTPAGKRTAVSGVVSVPAGSPPKRGWPVISYAHGTTGIADVCAPSRTGAKSRVAPFVDYIDPELEDWIDAGYAVAQTDYQGLGTPGPHEYLIGTAEGRGVVDIVSAARQLDLDIGKRYLLAGHSQGGHAALFAAGLADEWDRGLRLRGTVAFAPASHIADQVDLLPALTAPSSLSALAGLILRGAASFSPAVEPSQLLTEAPLALYPQTGETCAPQLGASTSLGGIAPADLLRDGADTTALIDVLNAQNPAVRTDAPILIAQGSADNTVFPFLTDMLSNELEAAGDAVDYQVYDGVTHAGIPAAAGPAALEFFERRLPAGR